MDLMHMPGGGRTFGALNLATQGNLCDFAGYCRQHGWRASVIVQTEGLPTGSVAIHLHAADRQGRTTYFETHRIGGDAAKLAICLKSLYPRLLFERDQSPQIPRVG